MPGATRGWSARSIGGLCTMTFAHTFCLGVFPSLMPDMARGVGLSDWQLGTVAGIFGFARLLTVVPASLVVTRHLRLTLAAGPLLLAVGVLWMAGSRSFAMLAAARFTMGAAQALAMIGGLTAILRHHPAHTLGSALNAYELSAMLGLLGGAVLAGTLPPTLPWHLALLAACSPQLLGILVLPVLLPALPRAEPSPPARAAASWRGAWHRPRAGTLVLLAFVAGTTISMLWATLDQFTLPLRAAGEFGLERTGIARFYMILQICDIVMLPPLGLIADRFAKPRLLGGVALVLAAGTLLVTFGGVTAARVGCALVGMGMAGGTLPVAVLRQQTAPERIASRVALYRVGVDGGIFLGPFLSGLLGRAHLGVLPALEAVVLTILGLALLGRPHGERAREPRESLPVAGEELT